MNTQNSLVRRNSVDIEIYDNDEVNVEVMDNDEFDESDNQFDYFDNDVDFDDEFDDDNSDYQIGHYADDESVIVDSAREIADDLGLEVNTVLLSSATEEELNDALAEADLDGMHVAIEMHNDSYEEDFSSQEHISILDATEYRNGIMPNPSFGGGWGETKRGNRHSAFKTHGVMQTSNVGGYEVELSDDGDAARVRTGSSDKASDWIEITYEENEDTGELEAVIDLGYTQIPLGEVMRTRSRGSKVIGKRNGLVRRNAARRSPVQPVLVHGYDRESPFGYEHEVNDYYRAAPDTARPDISAQTATRRTPEQREDRRSFWDKEKKAGKPIPKSMLNGAVSRNGANPFESELEEIFLTVRRNGALSQKVIDRAIILSQALKIRNGALQSRVNREFAAYQKDVKQNGAKRKTSKRSKW